MDDDADPSVEARKARLRLVKEMYSRRNGRDSIPRRIMEELDLDSGNSRGDHADAPKIVITRDGVLIAAKQIHDRGQIPTPRLILEELGLADARALLKQRVYVSIHNIKKSGRWPYTSPPAAQSRPTRPGRKPNVGLKDLFPELATASKPDSPPAAIAPKEDNKVPPPIRLVNSIDFSDIDLREWFAQGTRFFPGAAILIRYPPKEE